MTNRTIVYLLVAVFAIIAWLHAMMARATYRKALVSQGTVRRRVRE